MHKPVLGFTATTATFATIALLPHFAIAPITILSITVAAIMVSWAAVYMRLQSRKSVRV